MGARRSSILILLAIAAAAPGVGSSAAAAASEVCTAEDQERGSCSAGDAIIGEGDYNGEEDCVDNNAECQQWAKAKECERNPGYMLAFCRRSCGVCSYEFEDTDFGEPQMIPPHAQQAVKQIVSDSVQYMKRISSDPEYTSIRHVCRNKDERCSEWAIGTGCEDNPNYMKVECAPACRSCDYILETKRRCALDPDGTDAMEAGGMDALFERMVRLAVGSGWDPTVLSRPRRGDGQPCGMDATDPCDAIDGPWVLTLENFITPEEIDSLLAWGAKLGYERSQAGDMIIEARTSSHAWCSEACTRDSSVLRRRIVDLTGIPEENYEYLQLLKYGVGNYYRPHSDFIEIHSEQSHGPRLLTFFMYFNEVEEGGGTRFPRAPFRSEKWPEGLVVEPRQGRVLIWPSVLDGDPYREDARTEHEAMPVEKGEKFAANAWIHLRDFQTPHAAGCPS